MKGKLKPGGLGDTSRGLPLNNWVRKPQLLGFTLSFPPPVSQGLVPAVGLKEGAGWVGTEVASRGRNVTWPRNPFSIRHPYSALPRASGSECETLFFISPMMYQASSEAWLLCSLIV